MDSGKRLVVLARALSLSARKTIDSWRAAGVHIAEELDAGPADGIAIFGFDQAIQHAVGRSLLQQSTPVTVFFEGNEGLTSVAELDVPFFEDALLPVPPSPDWDHALRLFIADPRVRFVFRTQWHHDALAARLGLEELPRSVIIPLAVERAENSATVGKKRVLFPGIVDVARRHGADLFVRTAVELPKEIELAVIAERIRDERVLEPLKGRGVLRLSEREAFASSTISLVTARDGDALFGVIESAARGVLPLALLQGPLTEDPGANVRVIEAPPAAELSLAAPEAVLRAEMDALTPTLSRREREFSSAPVLTIGVPAWNAEKFLARCLGSILRARNSGELEVIVVDDGSTDSTAATVTRLAEGNVRLVRQSNKGHGGAINTALREAKGEFFRVIDADDWVDSLALEAQITALRTETADLVLTGYAEDRPNEPLQKPVRTLNRLPPGAITRFDTILDPLYGLTSWGPILSTSTFRTSLLRKSGLTLTENSAYVDLEYCTLGLEFVETMRHYPLDLYRYSLGVEGQSVHPESYRKRFRQHEAVILRLCEFVKHNQHLSEAKRRYIAERVLNPVIATHLDVVLTLLDDAPEAKAFRRRMEPFPFVNVPPDRTLRKWAARAAKAALPPALAEALAQTPKKPQDLARTLGRFVLPGAFGRRRNSD